AADPDLLLRHGAHGAAVGRGVRSEHHGPLPHSGSEDPETLTRGRTAFIDSIHLLRYRIRRVAPLLAAPPARCDSDAPRPDRARVLHDAARPRGAVRPGTLAAAGDRGEPA